MARKLPEENRPNSAGFTDEIRPQGDFREAKTPRLLTAGMERGANREALCMVAGTASTKRLRGKRKTSLEERAAKDPFRGGDALETTRASLWLVADAKSIRRDREFAPTCP